MTARAVDNHVDNHRVLRSVHSPVDGIIPALHSVISVILSATTTAGHQHPHPTAPEPLVAPCDPGGGFPRPRAGCPDDDPLLGRVTAYDDGRVTVQPIRVWVTGPEGQAYAEAHGFGYPFANDYYQLDVGQPVIAHVTPQTVCTGVILVDLQDPLADHLVPCATFGPTSLRTGSITAALWFDGARLVQLSELYRP